MKQVAIRRSDVLRAQYMAEMSAFDPDMLVFIDETGSERRNSIHQYAYGLQSSINCVYMEREFLVLGFWLHRVWKMST